jgi:small subunit ribosomal protein S3
MGQKVIPISLRLNKSKNWNSQWNVEKFEYSNFLFLDLEIRKYFNLIFNYKFLKLLNIKIIKKSKNIYIYIYVMKHKSSKKITLTNSFLNNLQLYCKHYNIKIFIQKVKIRYLLSLKKKIKKIFFILKKNNRITNNIKKIMYNIVYALYTKNIEMISYYIRQMLTRKKRHKKPMQNFNKILQVFYLIFSNFIGYRLQFKGRLNGIKRKKKTIYQKGKIPLNSFQCEIKYIHNEFKTPSGICSIKLWIFLKKN